MTDDLGRQRKRMILEQIPEGYSPLRHLLWSVGVWCLGAIAAALLLRQPTLGDWLLVPLGLVFFNFVEWWLHRYVLHGLRFGKYMYRKHAVEHHALYRHDAMAVGSIREWYFVLIPRTALIGMFVLSAPMVLALWPVLGRNAALCFFIAEAIYVAVYEVLHLAYHSPADAGLNAVPFVRRLGRFHAWHHHPALMREYNFNVTLPIADAVLGTLNQRGGDR